jgi:hypothetical protein
MHDSLSFDQLLPPPVLTIHAADPLQHLFSLLKLACIAAARKTS